jgi:four helix bundle protein
MAQVRSFQELIVWQRAMSLVETTYQRTSELPSDERFGLIAQMRRAAVSVPSNIAEGYGRRTRGEYLQFLGVARGSLRELQTCVLLCRNLGFCSDVTEWNDQCENVARLLYRLEQSLAR